MKEKLHRFFCTKTAKIGLTAIGLAAVLVSVFLLQPTPQREAPTIDAPAASAGEGSNPSTDKPQDSIPLESAPSGGAETNASASSAAPSASDQNETTSSSSAPGTESNPKNEKDRYQTDPVPEGKPAPVEPEEGTAGGDKQYTCTLSIRCNTILQNRSLLKEEKQALLPADGVILAPTTVSFSEGESVFDVLKRVTRQQRIHMEFSFTPLYNSAYIEGIHNLYEFDCGNLSGWMYKVNGWFPNYGCSRYALKPGDAIEWVYTCDLGRDVDGGYSTGQRKDE